MQQVTSGNIITFTHHFVDSIGDPYDPPEVTFRIAKNANSFLSNPVTYTAGDITKLAVGSYQYNYQTTTFSTPGLYNARWDVEIEGVDYVMLETFQIAEPVPEASTILDAPRTYGVMMESARYNTLGVGDTDRIFLVGHADGLELNAPYQVNNMQEAVNLLGGSAESPMIRALLECYNTGARDLWLVASAPEGEYVPFDLNDVETRFTPRSEWGGNNFYERYYERLEETYDYLAEYDIPEIIVPLEAPMFDTRGVDFLTQLVDHCSLSYEQTSSPRIGVIGTRVGNFTEAQIQELLEDPRLDFDYGSAGKFVMIVAGEATFRLRQMPVSHVSPANAVAAAALATSPMNAGLTYKIINSILTPYGRTLTKAEVKALSAKKVNPLIRTIRGKRGSQFQAVLATDNTLASDGSDYWSVVQMRLVSKVIQEIRALANRALGTIGFLQFKSDTAHYLNGLVATDEIRDYKLFMERDQKDVFKANVDVSLKPYFGVREITFQIQVGPGA